MDVQDIVTEWLDSRPEYDGLVSENRECGCCLEQGIAPCGELGESCEAGYREDCGPECDHDPGEPGMPGWHIRPGKRPAVDAVLQPNIPVERRG